MGGYQLVEALKGDAATFSRAVIWTITPGACLLRPTCENR
jgi:hypothetical protein